ncbi:MAG: ABC transporter permease [Lachnospiraceae bacterium]
MNRKAKNILTSNEMIVVYIIAGLAVLIGTVNSAFWGMSTVVILSRAVLVTLMFAVCEMVIIISGGIDVSFPAIAGICMYGTLKIVLALNINNVLVTFLIAATIGLIFGVLNAILIAIFNLPPLIATLGVSSVANGATLAFLGTNVISTIPEKVNAVSKMYLFTYTTSEGVTYSLTILFLLPIIVCVICYIILKFTMLGRGIYAIGGDKNAARIAGINVRRIQFIVYMSTGAIAGVASIAYMILMRQADPSVLMGSEMMVIAAVVIGGTRITGGHGTVVGTILGVILIALVQNNLIMLGVPTHFQTFVVGLIIVIGTSITSLKAKRIANSAKI